MLNALRYLFLVRFPQKISVFFSDFPISPVWQAPSLDMGYCSVADDGRHWQTPDMTTLATPRSLRVPVTHTTANDVSPLMTQNSLVNCVHTSTINC